MKITSFLFLALSVIPSNALFGLFGDSSSSMTKGGNESPLVPGDESIMRQKEHGTSHTPVQSNLRWGCDEKTADRICNYNRHWAEQGGYWESTSFLTETADAQASEQPVIFYDSNTGEKLYTAPLDRSWADFIAESKKHGWPSFRDNEVNWDVVRVLKNGETVSVNGTHLGKHDWIIDSCLLVANTIDSDSVHTFYLIGLVQSFYHYKFGAHLDFPVLSSSI
jgi:hypothetical protein